MAKTKTTRLESVEILRAGGPIHGKGSPPEGDYWTSDDLRAMADAATELAGELVPPSKIGHDPASGDPAVGWLENIRLNDTGDALVCDIDSVPEDFHDDLKAKKFRTRSVELGRVVSQKTGKTYDWVVTGLAWLGAKRPAVQGLADPVLYEGDAAVEVRAHVEYAAGEVIWDPEAGFQELLTDVQAALNPGPSDQTRYWASDVSLDQAKAIVQNYDQGAAWVVPITVNADGTVTVAPSTDWVEAEQAWVKAAKEYAAKSSPAGSDSTDEVSDTATTYTDEQRRTFAEATGLEQDKVTDDMLAKAGVAAAAAAEAPKPDDDTKPEGDEPTRALEQKVETLADKLAVSEKRAFEAERDSIINAALTDGRFNPGERDSWEKAYELNPEGTRAAIGRLPKNDDLAREYGNSDETVATAPNYDKDLAAMLNLDAEALI